ncbi:hypothetical protein ACOID8_35380, partial [Klebsiella pneumoniae]
SFQAEGLKGEAEGWRVEARVLLGKELKEVRLAQGQLKAEVASLALGTPLKGRGILLESPAYRVRAEEATFTREEAQLQG